MAWGSPLAIKDERGSNKVGVIYGFVTTGDDGTMIRYDGTTFQKTHKFMAIFKEMTDTWLENYTVVVNCIYTVLGDKRFREGVTCYR